jgi:hypothetical protein
MKVAPSFESGNLICRVQSCLSDDLRKPVYQGHSNRFTGHCYVASEALYHLLGGKGAGLKPMVVRVGNGTHWFLKTDSGDILDPTVQQFPELPPYAQARPCGFLTKHPSKRARVLISRVKLR